MVKRKYINGVKILLAVVVAALGGWLSVLWQEETLWGKIPLFFFVCLWALVVLLFEKKYSNQGKSWRWLALSTLTGVLWSLGFPPIPMTFLMLIGLVPLLVVEHEISQSSVETDKWSVFKYAYHAFVTWNILTTWWVANTAFFAAFFAFFLNALFMTVPFLLYHQTKKISPKLSSLALVAFWMSFEMMHLRWEISWTWLNLGNAFAEFPSWVQWYEWTGTFGGTLWILVANLLIFKILLQSNFDFKSWRLPKISTKNYVQIASVVLLPILFSFGLYFSHEEKGNPVEVAVVQPNYEPHYEKFNTTSSERQQRFLKISQQIVTQNTKYLVFPETSFNSVNFDAIKKNKDYRTLSRFLASEQLDSLQIVTGVSGYNLFDKNEPHSIATRTQVRNRDTIYYEVLNAATQISLNQSAPPFYTKSKLVPGAEFIPYRQFFFWIQPLVEHLDGSFEGHGTQAERGVFESEFGKIAPVICYESIYGEYHSKYIANGAEAIFIMTNDGWWDNSAGHIQHLKFASLRAIETRRAIARSANTGVSAFLNQRGDILQPTEYGVQAGIRGNIHFNDELTFYVKYGDLIGRLGMLIAILLLLNLLVKHWNPKMKEEPK